MTHKPYEPPLIIARVDVVAAFPHLYMRHQAFLDPQAVEALGILVDEHGAVHAATPEGMGVCAEVGQRVLDDLRAYAKEHDITLPSHLTVRWLYETPPATDDDGRRQKGDEYDH